jgi:uncharacterized protein (DUF4415 family)
MKKLNRLSNRVTDENGNVENLPDEFFTKAKRGRPWPDTYVKKEKITLRIDSDVTGHFRKTGKGWQTRINDALRKAIKHDLA